MSLVMTLKAYTAAAIGHLYSIPVSSEAVLVNETKPEFEGDYTIVLFSLVKQLKKAPDVLGEEMGGYLQAQHPELITGFNVIKGFLNLTVADAFFTSFLLHGRTPAPMPVTHAPQKIIVEYASPNTNKPLHLGHLRNIFLGWSVAEIVKAAGHTVFKTCIVNDRGIHICKSMIAWQRFGNGATPESTGTKGDHFVGDYYVTFNEVYKRDVDELVQLGLPKEKAEKEAPVMQQAQQMLVLWEQSDPEVMALWKKMNGWVYEGFEKTYDRIGADFDKTYYESETYLLGKKFVEQGLETGVLYKKEDGSVWVDLTAEGLDEKLLLRRDGTSVYITQDLGLAQQKFEDHPYDQSIYVIGDEQNYHMKVLKLILQKLQVPYASGIYHLSYGMVELPSGRMKSREGTVVDADDIVDEMVREATIKTAEHSDVESFSHEELKKLYEMIGLGALKFFLLRVDPKKKMVFNPEESIDFHGFTGPFIQYTHARIKSILRKAGAVEAVNSFAAPLLALEKNLLLLLEQFTLIIQQAAQEHNPSIVANYIFSVAKTYNSFYAEHSVMRAETPEKRNLRLQLCARTAEVIAKAMRLLGIQVPERM
jgi:arginyl-tRNA synthetase